MIRDGSVKMFMNRIVWDDPNWLSTMVIPASLHFSDKLYCTKITVDSYIYVQVVQ